MRPTIVAPCYSEYSEARQDLTDLLDSIIEGGTADHCNVIVCLDAAPLVFEEEFEEKYGAKVLFINHTGNRLNFVGNANIGLNYVLKEAKGGAILINQDCIIPPWESFQNLLVGFTEKGAFLVSAQSVDLGEEKTLQQKMNELWNLDSGNYVSVKKLPAMKFAGYCYYIPRVILETVGLLDPTFVASLDDDDYIVRTLLAGFGACVSGVRVQHKGSHIDQLKEGKSRSGAYTPHDLGPHLTKYRAKYSIPPDVSHDDCVSWILQNQEWRPEMRIE